MVSTSSSYIDVSKTGQEGLSNGEAIFRVTSSAVPAFSSTSWKVTTVGEFFAGECSMPDWA